MPTPKRMNPRSIRVRTRTRRHFRLIPELLESRELLSTTWTVTSTLEYIQRRRHPHQRHSAVGRHRGRQDARRQPPQLR